MKMGTLRKIDSRMSRAKGHQSEARARPEEGSLHERLSGIEAVMPMLATREDLARVEGTLRTEIHQECAKVRTEMHHEFTKVRTEMHEGFSELRTEIHESFSELRTEIHESSSELRTEIHESSSELRTEMHQEFTKVRTEMHSGFGELRAEMHRGFSELRSGMDALTWRFIGVVVTVSTALVAATHFLTKAA
ncbi:hypothetical protein [Pandoraea pulmonicola]|nr:hypothetical protein [Pandoraea pulmonicola]